MKKILQISGYEGMDSFDMMGCVFSSEDKENVKACINYYLG